MEILKKLIDESKYADDIIIKRIEIGNNVLNIINIETITSSNDINEFILKKISYLKNIDNFDIKNYLFNNLPTINILKVNTYSETLNLLLNGFTILIINQEEVFAIETRSNLTRGVSESSYEKTLVGPKDSFIEHYNTNLGLIRRRIKTSELHIKTFFIGRYTKTKVGIIYIDNICKKDLINDIVNKLNNIDIDGLLDSNYLKKYFNNRSIFPSIKSTERPDLASMSLLEGKALILTDNSPDVLILPSFFIDFFHSSDDYYQKRVNITYIRLIRLLAFLIAIFLPAIYISLITHNPDSMPINLLLSFQNQRLTVPFPAFLESFIMITSFEILRESDIRTPSSLGSAISILGGLVLGDAAVSAGIVSPIMIIVVAISAISAMLIQSIEAVNSIRSYRFLLIILANILGFYGVFIGIIIILTNLSDIKSINKDFLYPFAPIDLEEQKDGFFKLKSKSKRNKLLTRNRKRGNI